MKIKLTKNQKDIPYICAEKIKDLLISVLKAESELDQGKEHFWVIGLKTQNTIKYIELVHLGGSKIIYIEAKQVLRTAIYHNVSSIIIAHNHPGGRSYPSQDDRKTTLQLKLACDIIGISLLDHIIVEMDNNTHFSFAEEHLILGQNK